MRIYVDTSVIGGYFDEKFRDATRYFFDALVGGRAQMVLFTLTVSELLNSPAHVQFCQPGAGVSTDRDPNAIRGCPLMVKDDEAIPGFHAVEFMRQAREQLSREMEGKSFEEFQRFLHEKLAKSELWQKLQERGRTSTSSR